MKKNLLYTSLFLLTAVVAGCSNDDNVTQPEKEQLNYSFKWKGYEADATNETEWCMSRSNRWVAFTDFEKKTQFMVNWSGGMSDGEKEDATVSLTREGNQPVKYRIAYFNLTKDGEDCTIDFITSDGSEGVVHFPL